MGAAAEHRYEAFAARQAAVNDKSANAMFVADLNALPKREGAPRPFGNIHFVQSRGGWFAECPTSGYGYFYSTLREAVRSWRVAVFAQGMLLVGVPLEASI